MGLEAAAAVAAVVVEADGEEDVAAEVDGATGRTKTGATQVNLTFLAKRATVVKHLIASNQFNRKIPIQFSFVF